MFSEEQINQLKEVFAPLQRQIENLRKGQEDIRVDVETIKRGLGQARFSLTKIELRQEKTEERLKDLQEESRKEHGDLGQNLAHIGEEIQRLQHVKDAHQDQRIARLEQHLNLTPLD
ncbi:hypothetical protein [Kitasatospora sp. NPDC005856]|uniref:hypothetical protein n=1 Tax=Kitasatospora sp. NPDC005856 TaxID=3154566 RepID=UPI0033C19A5B